MIDIRGALTRSKTVQQVNRYVTHNLTVHWNGPAFSDSDITQLKGDAAFHVNTRGWDGLSYHFGVGRDGQVYQCRDFMARLNHAGVPQGNSESLSVLVLTGEGMPVPDVQLRALEALIIEQNIPARYVLGHKFWPRLTQCPGPLLTRWLYSYWLKNSGTPIEGTTIVEANVRDEASVMAHVVRRLAPGTKVKGQAFLHDPFKGDCLWIKLDGTSDYIHASTMRS